MESIENLKKLATNLGSRGLEGSKVTEIQSKLEICKQHLKNDFRGHVVPESKCIQHCTQLALSEKPCSHPHTNTDNCGSCDLMYELKSELTNLVNSTTFTIVQDKEETLNDLEMSTKKIWQWRNHLIRSESENDDDNFEIIPMIHITDGEVKQRWHIISQIFSYAFEILKTVKPAVTDVYIRSDNAGCYHSLPLLSYLWKFCSTLPPNVKQYNFSEAQSGKDLCDSCTGTCRLHMLNFINEGHNISDAMEMKEALESYGGIRNTYVSVIKTEKESDSESFQCDLLKSFPVSQYNNFTFEDNGICPSRISTSCFTNKNGKLMGVCFSRTCVQPHV